MQRLNNQLPRMDLFFRAGSRKKLSYLLLKSCPETTPRVPAMPGFTGGSEKNESVAAKVKTLRLAPGLTPAGISPSVMITNIQCSKINEKS